MTIALGIDTGGMYTDTVLVNHDNGEVLAGTKALILNEFAGTGLNMIW
jgi:N-methylhydantoinase A/oxoprolinase/acetone carboxylase beta subunit